MSCQGTGRTPFGGSRKGAAALALAALLGPGLLLPAGVARADIASFTKACVDVNGGEVCPGDWIRCTLRVSVINVSESVSVIDFIRGSLYAEWRQVSPDLPPPATKQSAMEGVPLGPTQSGRFQWNDVPVGAGASLDLVYEAKVRPAPWGTINCQAATVRYNVVDQRYSNEECVRVNCTPAGANTQVTKQWVGGNPETGDSVRWIINIDNLGPQTDTNVRLLDSLDPALFSVPVVGFSRPPNSGGAAGFTIDATWGSLAPRERIAVTVDTVYADCSSGGPVQVCNQARIESASIPGSRLSDDPETPREFPDGTCRQATPNGMPKLVPPVVKKLVDVNGFPLRPGDIVHVSVSFDNHSPCPATGGWFSDRLPPEVHYRDQSIVITPPSGTASYVPGTNTLEVTDLVGAAGTTTIEFDVVVDTVPPSGEICNTGDYSFASVSPSRTTKACEGGLPDQIEVTKSHSDPNGNGFIERGQRLVYRIDVVNQGPGDVTDAFLFDVVPTCLRVVAVQDAGGGIPNVAGRVVTVRDLDVPAASRRQIVVEVEENGSCASGSSVCNTAVVDSARSVSPVVSNDSCIDITTNPLRVRKSHTNPNGNDQIGRSQTFDYLIEIWNLEATAVTGVTVSDLVPRCFSILSVDSPGTVNVNLNQVDITDLTVEPGSRPTVIDIWALENLSCFDGSVSCNRATFDSPPAPSPRDTNDACLTVVSVVSCVQTPLAIKRLLGSRSGIEAQWRWTQEPYSVNGYRVYSVSDRKELDPANGSARGSNPEAELQCRSALQSQPACDDANAFQAGQPSRLFYQVLGVCIDGSEGAN